MYKHIMFIRFFGLGWIPTSARRGIRNNSADPGGDPRGRWAGRNAPTESLHSSVAYRRHGTPSLLAAMARKTGQSSVEGKETSVASLNHIPTRYHDITRVVTWNHEMSLARLTSRMLWHHDDLTAIVLALMFAPWSKMEALGTSDETRSV